MFQSVTAGSTHIIHADGSELYLTQKKAAVSVVIAGKAAFLEAFKDDKEIKDMLISIYSGTRREYVSD